MLQKINFNVFQLLRRSFNQQSFIRFTLISIFLLSFFAVIKPPVLAQGPVNGGFEGKVIEKGTGKPLAGAVVQFINNANGFQTAKKSDQNGTFRQDTLQPGVYLIKVTLNSYKTKEISQELYATRSNALVPVPVELEKEETVAVITTPDPTPVVTDTDKPPVATTSPTPMIAPAVTQNKISSDTDAGANLNPRRDAAFNANLVSTLPLGGTTLTRSFDELALLAPGVAPPPQAIGNSVGPGVGGGVGTSGQFSVNGLRSRANNFTVDGSDNNDEDIGVRRQGFFSLVPQPIESIQEFQIITLLAPAQYGRNLGAQVNALSKSGDNAFHGTLFGFFNSNRINARNFFDGASGNTRTNVTGRNFFTGAEVPVEIDLRRVQVFNNAGEKDSSTLVQGGFAVGGRIVRDKLFFFVSAEGQSLNATQERHFVVPTVEQRGLLGRGATGLCVNLGASSCPNNERLYPTSVGGDYVFSLFPFANDPNGIYGRNTYTQALSADARGLISSGKLDYNFKAFDGRPQTLTARYNFTDDRRDLPEVGGALFSSIRPLVRTNNFSTYISGGLTDNISNEFRFSWGRTDLEFEELRDTTGFLKPVGRRFSNSADARFLLNAQVIENFTLPTTAFTGCNPNVVCYRTDPGINTTEQSDLGLIGQLIVAGFSPVGVDVFNFPQERTNDTFQFADILRWRLGEHNVSLGTDIRRTFLDSNLPRNSRPLVTFNGSFNAAPQNSARFASPADLAAAGAATGFFQSLVLPGSNSRINLRYNQLNFFAQDEWRVNSRLLLSFGLRYEYNSPPKEADNKIDSTFSQTLPARVSDLARFIDGRNSIFDSDTNNFAPRFGIAFSLDSKTVIRGGAGIYYDQILGAVVSQSRNVFPTFTTINFGGGLPDCFNNSGAAVNCGDPTEVSRQLIFNLFNPLFTNIGNVPIIQPGTLNTLNPAFVSGSSPSNSFLNTIFFNFPVGNGTPFGATLPTRELDTPHSFQYSIGVEREIFNNTFLSAAYVGTSGRKLLRFTTPNLGTNYVATINQYGFIGLQPVIAGIAQDPNRRVQGIGPITQFETTGNSQYDSLQFELHGRLLRSKLQYQASYVFGSVEDDVSDVFDLAGASALPQNSITFGGEYAPANFDVRHRITYSFIYDLPDLNDRGSAIKYLFGNWQIAGSGRFNTGQPFTVNSIFDVNADGNLTDRLNSTTSITVTGDGRQPLSLANNANLAALLAANGQDGLVPRNSFRAGSLLDLDVSFVKRFVIREGQTLQFRTDIFNFINRANFGIPVRFLEAPGFGRATDTVTPGRRIQFALKYSF